MSLFKPFFSFPNGPNGCFRKCSANSLRLLRLQRRQTEASSRAFLAAERSLWTERNYVRQCKTCTALRPRFTAALSHFLSCSFSPDHNSVGEVAAGKASRSLAQHIPGPGGIEGMKGAASGVVGELARARIALDERGQKLGELEERTAAMMASADSFSKHAHEVREINRHVD